MIYQNLEIHNVEELIPHPDGGVTWLRVPQTVYNGLESDGGRNMAKGSTGVELRFVLKGESARIRLRSLSGPSLLASYTLYHGGVQGGWQTHENNTLIPTAPVDLEIKPAIKRDLVRRMSESFDFGFDGEVTRVIFNRGAFHLMEVEGEIEPPRREQLPKKTLFAYGSSITHGSNAYCITDGWVSNVARSLGMDARNLGFAGSCRMEPAMIEYLASQGEAGGWDVITMELGINVLDWNDELIVERATNAISQVAGRNPEKPVFVISPFYCSDDFDGRGRAENWRRQLEAIVSRLALPNVTYISGTDLLPDMSYISADGTHPAITGVKLIGDRLTAVMKRVLK